MVVGTDAKGAISAVRVLTHKGDPGPGDKIELKKSNWIDSFVGRTLNAENEASWAVKKDGGEFDAFTGATITPGRGQGGENLLLLQQEHPSCCGTPLL